MFESGTFRQCVCRNSKPLRKVEFTEKENNSENEEEVSDLYNIKIFRINANGNAPWCKLLSKLENKNDFKYKMIINNKLDTVVADTDARVSICGTNQAKRWNLLDRMTPFKVKIKSYNSKVIPVYGITRCAVSFGGTSIPVEWHIMSGYCEPMLSVDKTLQLGIINFNAKPSTFQPILMIDKTLKGEEMEGVQKILANFSENFTSLGKLRHHQVKLHLDPNAKPVIVPPRITPYHLKDRVDKAIKDMIEQDVNEEHPTNQAAPWISCAVIAPKENGDMRVTLYARNLNKAIQSTNLPIPRHEDIKAKLAENEIFSKMDFRSAF